jgi:hypothetical protein
MRGGSGGMGVGGNMREGGHTSKEIKLSKKESGLHMKEEIVCKYPISVAP